MEVNKEESLDEIVFAERNKNYGAYYLRKTYQNRLWIGLGISLVFFIGLSGIAMMKSHSHRLDNYLRPAIVEDTMVVIDLANNKEVVLPPLQRQTEDVPKIKPLSWIPTYQQEEVDPNETTTQETTTNTNSHLIFKDSTRLDKQEESVTEEEDLSKVEIIVTEYPEFPGGDGKRMEFLQKSIHYPELAKQVGIQGTVYVSFIVNRDGKINDIQLERGIGGGCDEEAVRVVSQMPGWIPGKQMGRPVRVKCSMGVKFILLN